MAAAFDKQVTAWVRKSEQRLTAVYRQSIQDLVEEAQTDYYSGGNLPKDLGFLQSTGDAAIGQLPVGESEPPEGQERFSWDAEAALLVINRAQLGGPPVFFGWTAVYANAMEEKYGFARLAAQNWPQIVNKAARTIEQRVRR
jgi:hypothetical protein